jgi:hypothetical protein
MTTRRSFLAGLLAAAAAPAIVRAESLMKLWVPPQDIIRVQCVHTLRGLDYEATVVLGNGARIYEIGRVEHNGVVHFPKIVLPAGSRVDEVLVRYVGLGPTPQNVLIDLAGLPA